MRNSFFFLNLGFENCYERKKIQFFYRIFGLNKSDIKRRNSDKTIHEKNSQINKSFTSIN